MVIVVVWIKVSANVFCNLWNLWMLPYMIWLKIMKYEDYPE